MKVSSTALPPLRTRLTTNTMAQMISIMMESFLDSSLSLTCSGVSASFALVNSSAMEPISVLMPVPVTTARPRP